MLSSRLKAFVIPTSQRIASGHATIGVCDELDARPGDDDEHSGGELRAELRERRQRMDVVDQPRDEEHRDPQ